MSMVNDMINFATAESITKIDWEAKRIEAKSLISLFREPRIVELDADVYNNMSAEDKFLYKNGKSIFFGTLKDGRRVNAEVESRSCISLDIDSPTRNPETYLSCLKAYCFVHTTISSTLKSPRYRIIIPLSSDVNRHDYKYLSKKICEHLGEIGVDEKSHEVSRAMFMPTVLAGEKNNYFCKSINDKAGILDPKKFVQASDESIIEEISNVEDPHKKTGIVGSFCRAFTIQDAIAEFIPNIYIKESDTRYTYKRSKSKAGLVIYNNKLAYSFHETDPLSGNCLNAFDLVARHLFKKSNRNKEPRFDDLCEIINNVAGEHPDLQYEINFKSSAADDFDDSKSWILSLKRNTKTNKILNTYANLNIIFNKDSNLNCLAYNKVDETIHIKGDVCWNVIKDSIGRAFVECDRGSIRSYIETNYGIEARGKIDDLIDEKAMENVFSPIVDYLNSLKWDGKKRIATALTDYLGADDTKYVRETSTRIFTSAVMRALAPGSKFDEVVVLSGPQGIGKSTFVKYIAKDWFSDTSSMAIGKEAYESVKGVWIMELAELSAMRKTEIEQTKHFISKTEDRYRMPYRRDISIHKRTCIFIGTTNATEYLKDDTGNRRFVPIHTRFYPSCKVALFNKLEQEVDQLWAEAYQEYTIDGVKEYSASAQCSWEEHISNSLEHDERIDEIESYLSMRVPNDWNSFTLRERRFFFLNETHTKQENTNKIRRVTASEIHYACFGKDIGGMRMGDSRAYGSMILRIPGWTKPSQARITIPGQTKSRCYERSED